MSHRKRSRPVGENRAECPFKIPHVSGPSRTCQKCHESKKRKRDSEDDDKRVQIQISPFSPTGSFETHETMDLYYTVEPSKLWQDMTRYNSFVLNSIKYCKNAFVYVANESTFKHQKVTNDDKGGCKESDEWVARILEICASDEHHVYARIYWMYWPDELPHGTVYLKNKMQGRQPYHGTNELIASNHMDIINVASSVRIICKCETPTNPDKTLIECPSADCGRWMHCECLTHDVLMRVYKRLGTDKPHRIEGAVLNEEKADEAVHPLSPTDTEEEGV
ncbi:hypothetical protein FNYG_15348 [Fusarium nygamai]|uniref:BAH domain-containing protein n=1 Tax=Gibberella nygamai TaxID=42673 RepID=A0A2K0UF58_GIBNY|nr:hypothetical protein FNYG_15348 [Fusarium nygamai]